MKKHEVKEIPFNENTLLGVRTEDNKVWLGVKKACLDIGLSENQARSEIKKIQNSLLFQKQYKKLSVKFDTQVRETIVLSEDFVPMWLAQINLTPTMKKNNPQAVKKLLTYQLQAKDVLHEAFYKTDEQKDAFHSDMGLEGKLENMQLQVSNMENTLELHIEKLDSVMENMTLSTRQQQKLYKAAKDRINYLLGGAHSPRYKASSRSYFINLWNGLKSVYHCASYKDLNPIYFNEAFEYISKWKYVEI